MPQTEQDMITSLTHYGVSLLDSEQGNFCFAIDFKKFINAIGDKEIKADKLSLGDNSASIFIFDFDSEQNPIGLYKSDSDEELSIEDSSQNLMLLGPEYKKWFERLEALRDRAAASMNDQRLPNVTLKYLLNRSVSFPSLGQFIFYERSKNESLKRSLFSRLIRAVKGLFNYLNPFYSPPPPIAVIQDLSPSLMQRYDHLPKDSTPFGTPEDSPTPSSAFSTPKDSPIPSPAFGTPEDSPTPYSTPEDSPIPSPAFGTPEDSPDGGVKPIHPSRRS